MYRFNFLNKINHEKLEAKKRDKIVRMVFISSTVCLVLLLAILFLQSLNIGSGFKEAQNYEKRITEKSSAFRNKDFFKFKKIENVYNIALKRRNLTSVLNAVESSLDSSLIIDNFVTSDNSIEIRFVSRTSSSKSQLMSRMNVLKNDINNNLIRMNYVDEKKPLDLLRGPDIKMSYEDFQYWVFDFGGEFKNNAPVKAKAPTKSEKKLPE